MLCPGTRHITGEYLPGGIINYRRRYVHVPIRPSRVRQIQEALIKAGVLHESPNGRWDRATHDVLRRYQQKNGFIPTGLPEVKPLMKLVLGPHPLPQGLALHLPAQAHNQGEAGNGAASTSQPAKRFSSYQ